MDEQFFNTICKCFSQTEPDNFLYVLCFLGSGVVFSFFFREKFDFCLALDSHLTRQNRELYCVICAMLGYTRSVPLAVL